jgi:hypothetical protein
MDSYYGNPRKMTLFMSHINKKKTQTKREYDVLRTKLPLSKEKGYNLLQSIILDNEYVRSCRYVIFAQYIKYIRVYIKFLFIKFFKRVKLVC